MKIFWLCFFPLFVAVDAIGVLPIFINLVEELAPERIRRIVIQSVVTAAAVALGFLAIGTAVLNFLGVSVADFLVAGGTLLFAISMTDLVTPEKKRHYSDLESIGAVPIGVPLIVGPAVLTTALILLSEHGAVLTVAATIANIAIAGGIFWSSGAIFKVLGKPGSKTVSKLASLLLAAVAVKMIRKGIVMMIVEFRA
ncbi:MAG TPA: MarC family protein [Candidatus Brocadiia bacterium]|nr:MarC family protein [Candidatus Brocadiia bacterium]